MSVIAYFDESGDDGLVNYSSNIFILTATYMQDNVWEQNYSRFKNFRKFLKENYNIPIKEEFHTAHFFKDKDPYRKYNLTNLQRKEIVYWYAKAIGSLNLEIINTIIDKTNIIRSDYKILANALTYTIQRIENTSNWKYIIISDKGRISIMKKTARALQSYNPILSNFNQNYYNVPIKNMIEDILEKESSESYFVQISDFVSYIVNLYYKYYLKKENIPKRISSWLSLDDINNLMIILKNSFNLKASHSNEFGLVIYPKINSYKNTTLPSFEDGVVQ